MKKENTSNNPMIKLIESKIDGILATNHMLGRVWRIVLYKYGLSGAQWQRQLNKYQLTQKDKVSSKGRSTSNGNLNRQFAKDHLSWNGLMRGLHILEFDKIKLELTLSRRGTTRVIELTSSLADAMLDVDSDANKVEEK